MRSRSLGKWGRGDSNSHAFRHMILSHARLPVPALPRTHGLRTDHEGANNEEVNQKVNQFWLTSELLNAFLQSRREGISQHTLTFYHNCLKRFIGHELTAQSINSFLHNLQCGNAKQSYFRAIRALCNWLCREGYLEDNPIRRVDAPKVATRLLPSITAEQLETLLQAADNLRDQAIISLLFDSGLRLSEVASIKCSDIDWDSNIIRVIIKGGREDKAAFTSRTCAMVRQCSSGKRSKDSLFGMTAHTIQDMLSRLSKEVGFPCNAHAFRRGFACHLHRKGLSTLSIMHLGRWRNLQMVARYTQSITFDDCLEQYRTANGG